MSIYNDNGVKAILDGLNEVIYPDDAQVAKIKVRKLYAEQPGIIARFRIMPNIKGGWKAGE